MPEFSMMDRIRHLAKDRAPELVGMRRHLHQYPELSFEEAETGRYIASRLQDMGIPFTTGWAGHGIVGLIEGKGSGPVTALRADMDALPISEQTGLPFASVRPGVMHACGHDAHMTCLLGAAGILNEMREHWPGTIKLIFQPAEEKCPGGAAAMIEEGVLRTPAPTAIFGLHVLPELPAGKVGFREGMAMAAADELYLTIEGKGGHGAQPHLNVDPIAISAALLTALQQVVSRRSNPLVPCVLTFGKIWSEGGATNIIPARVHIEGTLRTFDEGWRMEAHSLVEKMTADIPRSMGGKGILEIRKGNPPLYNDPALTRQTRDWAADYLGHENVVDVDPRMGAEDFAWYSKALPACFWRLGTAPPGREGAPGLHSPHFDLDESALSIGAGLTAWIACHRQKTTG